MEEDDDGYDDTPINAHLYIFMFNHRLTTYLLTYFTPWYRVLLEKLTGL